MLIEALINISTYLFLDIKTRSAVVRLILVKICPELAQGQGWGSIQIWEAVKIIMTKKNNYNFS